MAPQVGEEAGTSQWYLQSRELQCYSSPTAIEVNIQIIRVFTKMREVLMAHKDILVKVEKIEKQLMKHDTKMKEYEDDIQNIFEALKELLNPPTQPRQRIGFRRKDEEIN